MVRAEPRGISEVSGRQRLPAGEPRKASHRNSRPAAPVTVAITPTWRRGDQVRWKDRAGVFRRDVGDGEHAEVARGERVYRVRKFNERDQGEWRPPDHHQAASRRYHSMVT